MKKITIFIILLFSSIITNAQNIGIGTTTPTEKLHIAGNVKADTVKPTAIKLTTNAGVSKVLTSDANGNATWQPGGWGLTGNMGTNPNINFLGTIDSTNVIFKVKGNEVMRLQRIAGGYVEIGTGEALQSSANLVISGFGPNGTYRGLQLPRLSTLQRNSIEAPDFGLTIFNTDTYTIDYWSDGWYKLVAENCDLPTERQGYNVDYIHLPCPDNQEDSIILQADIPVYLANEDLKFQWIPPFVDEANFEKEAYPELDGINLNSTRVKVVIDEFNKELFFGTWQLKVQIGDFGCKKKYEIPNVGYNLSTNNPATYPKLDYVRTKINGRNVTLKWNKTAPYTSFEVQVSEDKTFRLNVITPEITGNDSVTLALKNNIKYFVRIRGYSSTPCGVSYYSYPVDSITTNGGRAIYYYTGGVQNFTVPAGTNKIKITAIGAGGAGCSDPLFSRSSRYNEDWQGGNGAMVQGEYTITAGSQLLLFVGQGGFSGNATNGGGATYGGGGFGGNVDPSYVSSTGFKPNGGGSGGGASKVTLTNGNILAVAGGGGGASNFSNFKGYSAGGTTGFGKPGTFGTQTTAGNNVNGTNATGSIGGGSSTKYGSGGGGGGYYGGAGGEIAVYDNATGFVLNEEKVSGSGGSSYDNPLTNRWKGNINDLGYFERFPFLSFEKEANSGYGGMTFVDVSGKKLLTNPMSSDAIGKSAKNGSNGIIVIEW